MEVKHTPGPWSAFTDDSGARSHTNIFSVVPITDCVFSLPGHHKDEPNVRLIAAAPELLESLSDLVAVLDEDHRQHVQDMLDTARAAITKATQP